MKLCRAINCSMPRAKKLGDGKRKIDGRSSCAASTRIQPSAESAGNAAPAARSRSLDEAWRVSIEESLALELDAIVELGETESTHNLIRNFFLADK